MQVYDQYGVKKVTVFTFANPTGTIGLTAVNGSASTAMRSDAAPALSQAISPTWTGNHAFTPSSGIAVVVNGVSGSNHATFNGANAASSYMLLKTAGTTIALFGDRAATSGSGSGVGIRATDNFAIATNGANERFLISSTGNVTISAPSSGTSLTINGTAATAQRSLYFTGTTTAGSYLQFDNTGAGMFLGVENSSGSFLFSGNSAYASSLGTTGNTSLTFASNSVVRISINGSGNIRFHAYGAGTLQTDASGNITAVSDIRLKRGIRPYSAGLAELMQLEPILYGYTRASGLDQTKEDYAGFSAQNVQAVIPEAVDMGIDGYLGVSDRPIIAALVNAIKELNTRLAAVELQ